MFSTAACGSKTREQLRRRCRAEASAETSRAGASPGAGGGVGSRRASAAASDRRRRDAAPEPGALPEPRQRRRLGAEQPLARSAARSPAGGAASA